MYIVMIATECAPAAKVGGLADVIYGLSHNIQARGNTVEVILPKYQRMRYDQIQNLKVAYEDLWVPWKNSTIHCTVWSGHIDGLGCYFIEPHSAENFFNRDKFYGYPDEAMRMAFFSKAALEFLFKSEKRPDILHCHDWQTGLVPVMLFEIYEKHGMSQQRVCYTIHNFKHQGVAGQDILQATGLNRPEYYCRIDKLRDDCNFSSINFMKGGIVYSNFTTTVSPQYAFEVRFGEQSYGLGQTLQTHHHKFGGILNGLDYDAWNPETDPCVPVHYHANSVADKYRNKEILRRKLLLQDGFKPIITYIGRLDTQKGVHLIRHGIFHSLNKGAQFVLLGESPERSINDYFWQLKNQLNDNPDCHLEIGFSEELSRLIYAGSDMIIVPSIYEPCGLTQIIALRYGVVPIVRGVGGLINTVFDRDYADQSDDERNGYVFYQADYAGLESALNRALGLWYDYPQEFRKLIRNGMSADYSWHRPGQDYLNVYEFIRHK